MHESGCSIDLAVVRRALRSRLADHGYRLSGDTVGAQRALYIMGENDLAAAVFEVKPSADEAVHDLMLQGTWAAGMPPRFAVVPSATAGSDSLEMLMQLKATPVLFEVEGDAVEFCDLDEVLREHLA